MIPLMKVHLPPKEELMPELESVIYEGSLTEGKEVRHFQSLLREYINCSYNPLALNSGTAALKLAYRCANIKGKIVLSTPITCPATNMEILGEGGKIVWCDTDKDTGMICTKDIENKLEKYGKEVCAISFVDLGGYTPNIKELIRLKEKYGVLLIQDSAQSFGAKYEEKYVGANEKVDFTCFSFQALKHLNTADGGGLVCQTKESHDLAKKIKWYGVDRETVSFESRWFTDVENYGYKIHMNNLNAKFGIIQLRHIDKILKLHKENGKYFNEHLKNVSGFTQLKIEENCDPSYWTYVAKVENRKEFKKMMKSKGIEVCNVYMKNNVYSCFKDPNTTLNHNEELPNTNEFQEKFIFVPCGWWLTDEEKSYIVSTIKEGW